MHLGNQVLILTYLTRGRVRRERKYPYKKLEISNQKKVASYIAMKVHFC